MVNDGDFPATRFFFFLASVPYFRLQEQMGPLLVFVGYQAPGESAWILPWPGF
jgi:hypothetical protein